MASRVLVTGGVRAGKSRTAADLVAGCAHVRYVATGSPSDEEMRERIAAHRADRPPEWSTAETCDLAEALRSAPSGAAVVIDALPGWLADRMAAHDLWAAPDAAVAPLGSEGQDAFDAVVAEADHVWELAAAHEGGPVVLVADESGLGVTPADPSSRRWLDLAGVITRRLGAAADRVVLCHAGRRLELPPGHPGPPAGGLAASDPAGLSADRRNPPPSRQGPISAAAGLSADRRDPPPSRQTALETAPGTAGDTAGDTAAESAAPSRTHGDTMVPEGAMDFAVNVHGAPPAHVRHAIDGADPTAYPDERAATAAAAARHGRSPAETLVTAGAAEAFWLLARVAAVRRACVVHPGFTEPEAALRAVGVGVTRAFRAAEDGWRLDAEAVPGDADLVVVANPNNPTGVLDDPEELVALTRPGRLTVVDEAFMDFVPDERASLAARPDLPGVVVVRSVTKLWGLAGLRAGYLLGPAGLVARCEAARQPWPVAAPALAALEACLADEAHPQAVAEQVARDRDHLVAGLRRLPGVAVTDGAANFVLVHVSDGPEVVARLAKRGLAVRPSTFPGLDEDHFRVTVRDERQNQALLEALADVLGERV